MQTHEKLKAWLHANHLKQSVIMDAAISAPSTVRSWMTGRHNPKMKERLIIQGLTHGHVKAEEWGDE